MNARQRWSYQLSAGGARLSSVYTDFFRHMDWYRNQGFRNNESYFYRVRFTLDTSTWSRTINSWFVLSTNLFLVLFDFIEERTQKIIAPWTFYCSPDSRVSTSLNQVTLPLSAVINALSSPPTKAHSQMRSATDYLRNLIGCWWKVNRFKFYLPFEEAFICVR